MKSQRIFIGNWIVVLYNDGDNQLCVDVSNFDGTQVIEVDEDLSDGNAFITRLTTEKIEADYLLDNPV